MSYRCHGYLNTENPQTLACDKRALSCAIMFGMSITTYDNAMTLSTQLANLGQATQDKILAAITASKSPATLRAYQSDMRQLGRYLHDLGHDELVAGEHGRNSWRYTVAKPVPAALVAAYLVDRHEHGTAVASLRRHMASISKWHQAAALASGLDIANPCTTMLVRDCVTGLRKENTRTVRQAPPLLEHHLAAMVNSLDMLTLRGHRDKAMLLLGWCGALRRAELGALTWAQVQIRPGEGIVLTIMGAKTDKAGEGQQVGVPYQDNVAMCPVRALQTWAGKAGHTLDKATGPVFTQIGKHGNNLGTAMGGQAVAAVINQRALQAGLPGFTGHSLRAGLATAAILAGRQEHEVMTTTRHRSQAVFRGYVRAAELLPKAASRGLLS